MAAPTRLFPEPIPLPVRLASLREQGTANRRTQAAHNKQPVRPRMRDLGSRRKRRRWRTNMRVIVAALA